MASNGPCHRRIPGRKSSSGSRSSPPRDSTPERRGRALYASDIASAPPYDAPPSTTRRTPASRSAPSASSGTSGRRPALLRRQHHRRHVCYRGALAGSVATPYRRRRRRTTDVPVGIRSTDGNPFVAGGATGASSSMPPTVARAGRLLPGRPGAHRRDRRRSSTTSPSLRTAASTSPTPPPAGVSTGSAPTRDRRCRDPAGLPRLHRHRPAVHQGLSSSASL